VISLLLIETGKLLCKDDEEKRITPQDLI